MMKNKVTAMLLSLFIFVPALAFAGETTSDKVKEVMDYYHTGKTVVLVDSRFCSEIGKEGDLKNECAVPADAKAVAKGSRVFFWMNFFVPGDDADHSNVLVQFKYKGKAIDSSEVSMSQSIRYRTWLRLPSQKEGEWQISIEQENEDGYVNLETLDYTVVDSAESTAADQ